MNETYKRHTLDLVARVLEEIGNECRGVRYWVDDLLVSAVLRPTLFLKWDPTLHPKTRDDPTQAIVLESVATGRPLKDDTLRRALRDQIEHMIKVDQHAHREWVTPKDLHMPA